MQSFWSTGISTKAISCVASSACWVRPRWRPPTTCRCTSGTTTTQAGHWSETPLARVRDRTSVDGPSRSAMVSVFSFDLGSTEHRLTSAQSHNEHNGRRHSIWPRVNLTAPDHCPSATVERKLKRRRAEQKSGEALAELADCYRGILAGIGEDPDRQGLRQTPERAARAMLYFTKGYDEKIEGSLVMVNCK